MICKGIASTTQVDAHNMQMTKEALEKAAQDVNAGEYVPAVGVEHDLTVMPIGKVYKAFVDKFGLDDYALYIEQEIFDDVYTSTIGEEKYILLKSALDNRPFASDKILDNDKLIIQTDPVNFESYEKSEEFLSNLNARFNINVQHVLRKSIIPDPELVFQFAENFVKYLLIYLSSKQVVERVGDALVDTALTEIKYLYGIVKKAIKSGATYLVPRNRPVTYVFRGNIDYIIELIVKTKSPDIAINALNKNNLKEAIDKIESIKTQFPRMRRVQLLYNENDSKWAFNYLTTETGEVIGTEQSYEKSTKLVEMYLGDYDNTNNNIGPLGQSVSIS